MADWRISFNWMMAFEDPALACKQTPDACPEGVTGACYAICGINSGVWPAEFAAIAAQPRANREFLVQQFYRNHFWSNWYEQLTSDELCKRVFDFAVNGGSGTAVRCLQEAVNAVSGRSPIAEDGGWGPTTVAAANAADPDGLVTAFKNKRLAHYRAIANGSQGKSQYMSVWKARAEA